MPIPDIKKALDKVNLAAIEAIKQGERKAEKIAAIQEAIKKESKK